MSDDAHQVDLGPVNWVKGEIFVALKQAQVALESCRDESVSEESRAKFIAQTMPYVQQVRGALSVVRLQTLTQIAGATEKALAMGIKKEKHFTNSEYQDLIDALAALGQELNNIVNTGSPQPFMRLWPSYKRLQIILGVQNPTAADLFFPDLTQDLPEEKRHTLPRNLLGAHLSTQREHFQKALLKFVQSKNSDGIDELAKIVSLVNQVEYTKADQRALWWIANGFLDAVKNGDIKPDFHVYRLCGSLDRALRLLSERPDRGADGFLMRDMAYQLGRTELSKSPVGHRVAEHYQLNQWWPKTPEISTSQQDVIHQEFLEKAIYSWGKFCAGTASFLPQFHDVVMNIVSASTVNQPQEVTRLISNLAMVASILHKDPLKFNQAQAREVATALSLLKSMVQSGSDPRSMQEHVDLLSRRVAAVMEGQEPPEPSSLLVDMARYGRMRVLTPPVVEEAMKLLGQIESELDPYFRNPTLPLPNLTEKYKSIDHYLEMLNFSEARKILNQCQTESEHLTTLAEGERALIFIDLANKLARLSFYLDVNRNAASPEQTGILDPRQGPEGTFRFEPGALKTSETQLMTSFVAPQLELAVHKTTEDSSAAPLPMELDLSGFAAATKSEIPTSREEKVEIDIPEFNLDMPNLDEKSQVVDEMPFDMPASSSELNKPEIKDASPAPIDLKTLDLFDVDKAAKKPEKLETLKVTEEPTPEVMANPPEFGVDISAKEKEKSAKFDPELLKIFLEEGAELLPNLDHDIDKCRENPSDKKMLGAIRRAFHTFKGSSRMVGLKEFGDVAWAMEQVLNNWLVNAGAAAPKLLALCYQAYEVFSSWLSALSLQNFQMPQEAVELSKQAENFQADEKEEIETPESMLADLLSNPDDSNQAKQDVSDLLEAPVVPVSVSGPVSLAENVEMELGEEHLEREKSSVEEVMDTPHVVRPSSFSASDDAIDSTTSKPINEVRPSPSPSSLSAADEQVTATFLEEGYQSLEIMHQVLAEWDDAQSGLNGAPLRLIRTLHTLKGSARMAGAMKLGEFIHKLETDLSFEMEQGNLDATVRGKFSESLELISAALSALDKGRASPKSLAQPAASIFPMGQTNQPQLLDSLINDAGEIGVLRAQLEVRLLDSDRSLKLLTENVTQLKDQLRELEIRAETQMLARKTQAEMHHKTFDPLEMDRFTRLQELTRMMVERVNDISMGQQELVSGLSQANNALTSQSRLNRSLLQGLMKVRLVPFAIITERLIRTVALAGQSTGRNVRLEIIGDDVQVDPNLPTRIVGALEHLLRNAVAHGIEDAATRAALRKPAQAVIRLHVAQVLNQIHLEVSDDGQGLNLDAIRDRAKDQGFLGPEGHISDQELIDLLFIPGFTTTSSVTETSGRGVGLDVVRNQVTQLGGHINVENRPGKGATFQLRLPLTSAITQALLIKSGKRIFALPTFLLERIQRCSQEEINRIRRAGFYETADNEHLQYPYHRLSDLLGIEINVEEHRHQIPLMLIKSGHQRMVLEVDEIFASREIMLKSTGPQVSRVLGVSGATILADGEIVLMLNPLSLSAQPKSTPAQAPQPAQETKPDAGSVMVVDDSLTVRRITSRLLSRMGYRVFLAKDGVEALQQLEQQVPQVMLVDIEMPRMDGFELLRHIRSDERWQGVPVIMITSRMGEKHRRYALSIGANHYLGKPYQEMNLLELIALHVNGKATHS